jgi:hypothetical protein
MIEYLNYVKDLPKERARFAIEASKLYNFLINLQYRLEEGGANEAWIR